MKRFFLLSFLCLFVSGGAVVAQESKPSKPAEYTSRADVAKDATLERDFKVQGEYTGSLGDQPIGVNMIADGDGKFRLVAFLGGLPGDGWSKGMIRIFGTAKLNDDGNLEVQLTEIDSPDGRRKLETNETMTGKATVKVADGKLTTVPSKEGEKEVVFTKIERTSPTMGKVDDGATVLFDGNGPGKFKGKVDEEAKTLWSEASTEPFEKKPYKLHVEFLLSYMPTARGQARGNSGVYIDEAYECQVLDSFGLEGENNECGGFYQVSKPAVNMCYPPLQWQTYDIDFAPAKFDADGKKTQKAKISVKHNGVVIHDGIEPEKETPGRKKETAEARGLYFQGHGNKIQYRNVWMKYVD